MPLGKQRENKAFLQCLGWTDFAELLDWHQSLSIHGYVIQENELISSGKENPLWDQFITSFVNIEI